MLNYKECSIEDFNAAMKEKNSDVETISTPHLYILYTKFKSDASACSHIKTSYASGLVISSKSQAEVYKKELQKRGITVL